MLDGSPEKLKQFIHSLTLNFSTFFSSLLTKMKNSCFNSWWSHCWKYLIIWNPWTISNFDHLQKYIGYFSFSLYTLLVYVLYPFYGHICILFNNLWKAFMFINDANNLSLYITTSFSFLRFAFLLDLISFDKQTCLNI